jgi:hypothetical protein
VVTFGILLFGQACGGFKASTGSSSQSSNLSITEGLPKDFTPKPNTATASLVYARQALDSMISCTGIKTSDATINNEFEKRKGSLSEYGYATQVTAPMLMAATAVAGEVCNKLINNERAQAADQRRIFNAVNFNANPALLSSNDLRDVTRRLARSCWLRNETDQEFEMIESGFREAFNDQTSASATRAGMLMVCTGLLSSLSGLEM